MHTELPEIPDHKGNQVNHKLVEVELNGGATSIPKGPYSGRTLKVALNVPEEYELDEVKHGKFRPVGNDDKTHIEGGEKFVSQVGQGQSS